MSKKEEEYLTLEDIEDRMADFLTITLSSGKKIVMRRLSKDEESKIRRKHMKNVYDDKQRRSVPTLDTDAYNDDVLYKAIVTPKLTKVQVVKMDTVLYNEIYAKYATETGLLALTENLDSMLRVI